MAFFKDEQEVYEYIGRLFQDLAVDEVLFPQFQKANTIVAFPLPQSDVADHLEDSSG